MAAAKRKLLLNCWLTAGFLALSGCAEQAINPSLEYAAARSNFLPKTKAGTDCKLQCEQAWGKCFKSTYACDREGAACINACADRNKMSVPENAKAGPVKPTVSAEKRILPEAQPNPQDTQQSPSAK